MHLKGVHLFEQQWEQRIGLMFSFKIKEPNEDTWRRQWHPTPVLLPGKSHGWRSLVGCNPCGRQESDMTEQLHFHFSLSCTGEGNGNPLQCSCLENPRDGGAWWAAIYGVAQSQTRLKWLSSNEDTTLYTNLNFEDSPWKIKCNQAEKEACLGVMLGFKSLFCYWWLYDPRKITSTFWVYFLYL